MKESKWRELYGKIKSDRVRLIVLLSRDVRLLLITVICAYAQIWTPLGKGILWLISFL
jgi:hypothetical protein